MPPQKVSPLLFLRLLLINELQSEVLLITASTLGWSSSEDAVCLQHNTSCVLVVQSHSNIFVDKHSPQVLYHKVADDSSETPASCTRHAVDQASASQ